MAKVCALDLKAIRIYCKTDEHRRAVSAWVKKHCGIEVKYDKDRKGWVHDGDANMVAGAITELSRRMLFHRVDMYELNVLAVSAIRRRLAHWRINIPAVSVYTWPDTRGEVTQLAKLNVWVVALPPDAFQFAEAASEFQGLSDRFTVVTWMPHGECATLEGANKHSFMLEHGLGGMSSIRPDGSILIFGTAESVMFALEALGNTGHIVRKGRPPRVENKKS